MLRNIWIAVGVTLWSGSLVLAQLPGPTNGPPPPYGSPGAIGYPGYPMPPYGPPLPMGPMGPGYGNPPPMMPMGPNMPYGNPGPMGPGAMMPYGNPGPMGPGAMMPYGNPGPMGPGGMMPYGNPGPMGPGAMMPNMPYGNPGPMGQGAMMPNSPYGNPLPVPIPPDPRRPVAVPNYDGGGPKQGATEPYMVGPEKSPTAAHPAPTPTLAPAPGYAPTPMMHDPSLELASCCPPGPPAEPYTLYEGARYAAEVKQDCVCVFGQVNYIHWWTRHDQTPPLLTTGNPNIPGQNVGTLGNSDTVVLVGGAIDPHEFSGVQANFGFWLDPERLTSLEFGGFYLGKNSRQYSFASDANGNNVIAQPVLLPVANGYAENALTIASPGLLAGSASFSSVMNLCGAEVNFGRNLLRYNCWSLDALVGFRYMYLNDTLTATQNSTVLPGFANNIAFLGVTQPAGANFVFNDSFNLTNRFYGAQIGARGDWIMCGFDIGATVKVAFGDTNHTAIIDGTTTLNNAGGSSTVPGGAYSQPSDIGHYNTNDFTVATELTLTFGYQIHPNIRLTFGYNLLYWPRVERAGEQIERTMDSGQSATDPAYTGIPGIYPRFLNMKNDFWAQGVNVGVEVKY